MRANSSETSATGEGAAGGQSAGEPESAASIEELEAENARLRDRISGLETELVEVQAKANAAVARWQERAYWLERWHLDLNAAMRRPGAMPALELLRAARTVMRALRRVKQRILP